MGNIKTIGYEENKKGINNYLIGITNFIKQYFSDDKIEYILSSCDSVTSLELKTNNINGVDFRAFKNLKILKLLNITSEIIEKIREFKELQHLTIKKPNDKNLDLSSMNLKSLHIYSNTLASLNISKNSIDNITLSELAKNISKIDASQNDLHFLDFTQFYESILEQLLIIGNPIKEIKFSQDIKIDVEILKQVSETIEVIDLSAKQYFDLNYFKFTNLKILRLPDCDDIPWNSIKQMIYNSSHVLQIESNQKYLYITDFLDNLKEKALQSLRESKTLKKRATINGGNCEKVLSLSKFSLEWLDLRENATNCFKKTDLVQQENKWEVNTLVLEKSKQDLELFVNNVLPNFIVKDVIIINCKILNWSKVLMDKVGKFICNKGSFDKLNLSDQNLTKIPDEYIPYLPYFETIDLSGNRISDLSFLKKLHKIKSLNLNANNVSEDQIPNILKLRNETEIDLCSEEYLNPICFTNKLVSKTYSKSISWISQLKHMKYLTLENQDLTEIPKFISQLTFLRNLNLSNNKITKIFSTDLPLDLVHLNITNNPSLVFVDKNIFKGDMNGSLNLHISKENQIEEFEIFPGITKLPDYFEILSLKKLTLNDYPFKKYTKSKKFLCTLFPNLQELYVGIQETAFWFTLRKCHQLKTLYLFPNAITNENSKYFMQISSLKTFEVESSEFFSNIRSFFSIFLVHHNLEVLRVKATKITGVDEKIWQSLPSLKEVSFENSTELVSIDMKGSQFETLNLDGCSNFIEFKRFFGSKLNYLNISGTRLILEIEINNDNHLSIVKNYFECGFSGNSSSSYYLTKVTLLGDPYAGKTTLFEQLTGNEFSDSAERTKVMNLYGYLELRKLLRKNDDDVKRYFTFQDFGGQVFYRSYHTFALSAEAIHLIVYDLRLLIQNGRSYIEERMEYYLTTLHSKFKEQKKRVNVLLVGNYYSEALSISKEFAFSEEFENEISKLVNDLQKKYVHPIKIFSESKKILVDVNTDEGAKKISDFLNSHTELKRGPEKKYLVDYIVKRAKDVVVEKESFKKEIVKEALVDNTLLGNLEGKKDIAHCRINFMIHQFVENGYILEDDVNYILNPSWTAQLFHSLLFNLPRRIFQRQSGNIVFSKDLILSAFQSLENMPKDEKSLQNMIELFENNSLIYPTSNNRNNYVIPSLLATSPPKKVTKPSKRALEIDKIALYQAQWIFHYSFLHLNVWHRFVGNLAVHFHPEYDHYLWKNGLYVEEENVNGSFLLLIQLNPRLHQIYITARTDNKTKINQFFQEIEEIERESKNKENMYMNNIIEAKFSVNSTHHFCIKPFLKPLDVNDEDVWKDVSKMEKKENLYQIFPRDISEETFSKEHFRFTQQEIQHDPLKIVCDYQIVLIHDIGGDSKSSWTSFIKGSEFFWPKEFLENIAKAGYQNGKLFSLSFNSKILEGYPIDTSANQLLLAMLRQDIGQCPFFLITTSNGGLVVNRVVIDAKTLSDSNSDLEIVPKAKMFLSHLQGVIVFNETTLFSVFSTFKNSFDFLGKLSPNVIFNRPPPVYLFPIIVLIGMLKERNTLDLSFSIIAACICYYTDLTFALFYFSLAVCTALLVHIHLILFFVEIIIMTLRILFFFFNLILNFLFLIPFIKLPLLSIKNFLSYLLSFLIPPQQPNVIDFFQNLQLQFLTLEDMQKALRYFFFVFFFLGVFVCFTSYVPTIASLELSDMTNIQKIKEKFTNIQRDLSIEQLSFRDLIKTKKNLFNDIFFTQYTQNETGLSQTRSYPFDINQNSPIFEETLEFMINKLNNYYDSLNND